MDKPNASVVLLYQNWAILCNTIGVDGVGQKAFLSHDVFATKHAKRFSMGWVKRCPGNEFTCAEK